MPLVEISPRGLRRFRRRFVSALIIPLALHAELQWNVFNETTSTPAPASTATSGVVITIPAGQRATLVATNFVPIDLTAAGTENYTTINFKVSGGLSSIAAGTRAIGFGLFNHNGTASNYADDSGYFTWLNGRNTGSLIEQRRRIGDGTSPSLLNPTGTAFNNVSTGQAALTPGSLSDGNSYSIQLHLMGRSGSVSFGNTSANTTGAGVWVSGPGISTTTFSNPDAPAAAFVFNEIGFMFFNSTSAPVTLTINSVIGLTAINPPSITTPPVAISLNPGQAGALTVAATGTPPLTYQWRKDGTNLAGATSDTYNFANAAAADSGSYSVVITNAYGTVTSPAAAVTITTSPIPATIANQPASITRNVGDNASFTVAAFGSSPVTYQWRKDGVAIAGATGTTLNLTSVTPANAGSYTVVVTAGGGATTVTSSAATLTVNTAPAITTQPASVTTSVGQNVTFSVAATGSPTPSYQWSRNGVAIPGATSATLTINNVTLANAGAYAVSLINDVGAATSAVAVLAIPSSMVTTAVSPANGRTGVNIDTPLSLTFDRAPVVGSTGRIRIYRAADDTVVETIDLGASLQQRTVGSNASLYNFFPVTVTGNTAFVYPHAGILAYGQSYYVTIEQSAILDSVGASFTGISDKSTWRFTTKTAGPAANATALTVAADGSGDFTTVQGAVDFVPAGNTQRVVITVKKGTYNELVYIGATRPFITIRGEDRAQTIVGYPNNNNLNGSTATRAAFSIAANDSVLETITIRNPTPQGGSQAEAVFTGALRVLLNRVNLLSRQDTLLTNTGTAFVTDSYIEGNTDFMWGTAAAYFQNCELKALDTGTSNVGFYTQIRNPATGFGNVYVNCKLTVADGVVGRSTYFLGRIDPGPGNFPFSQCIWIDCAMGPHITPEGWRLDNATTSSTIQYWEYRSTDFDGVLLDVSRRHPSSRQLSEAEATQWRNPAYVLGGWVPEISPTIESPSAPQAVTAGSIARLTVSANGYPAPALQWYRNGVAIPGATNSTLYIPNVQPSNAGTYTVTAASALGTVTSSAGTLTVQRHPYAGTYFGTISGSTTGTFAMYVRDNGVAVMLAQWGNNPLINRQITLGGHEFENLPDGAGRFSFPLFAADAQLLINGKGSINPGTGAVNGTWEGIRVSRPTGSVISTEEATFSGMRSPPTGLSGAFAGYFRTAASVGATTTDLIVGTNGQAFAYVDRTAFPPEAGSGTVNAAGDVNVRTSGFVTVVAAVAPDASSATVALTATVGAGATLFGANDALFESQQLRQFSSRSRVDATNAMTLGFIITGAAPKDVVIRAVGPSLADSFSVSGALANPRLDLYRENSLLAGNAGWSNGPSPTRVALGGAQTGAFPLRATVADSALRLTLPPGTYSAVMRSASGSTAGSALLELYDVTGGAAGERFINFSTLALAGTGANTLVSGLYIDGSQPKRVLIRAVGPGLTQFGVTGALARPVLTIYRGATLVAQNAGWSTTLPLTPWLNAFSQANAFFLDIGSADSALLLNLNPGAYTAQVSSPDNTTGTVLLEVYEMPSLVTFVGQ